jgi:hypothetical protein
MAATQKIHVGMIHADKVVATACDHSFQVDLDRETIAVVPRPTTAEIHRYKAYATQSHNIPDHEPAAGLTG